MKRQTLHFPFCQDLGNKKVIDIIWPEKINFALFKIKQRINLGGGRTIPDTQIDIPGFYEVQKVNIGFWSSLTEDEYQTFIAPSDYNTSELFYVREKQVKITIPDEFLQLWKEQPHLIEHATFQFYFLNENLFSANLPFLRINDNNQIEVDWKVRAAPSGTFLFFRSGHIFFKWKIEVRQGLVNLNAVKETVKAMMETAKKAGGLLVKFFSAGTVNLDGKETKAMEKLFGNALTGKDNWEKIGLGKERTGKVQEQHTERMFKSTYAEALNNTIEPSIFYSNTITFPYNLFDYWLRNEKDPFFVRIYHSSNLFNNLVHNNNENPITYPLNITFEKLGNILRKGYWQGKLNLDYDPGGKMAACFAGGVTFYENKDKSEFPNPKLGVKEIADQIKYSGTGGDNYTSQTITEPKITEIPFDYRPEVKGYGHQTYLTIDNNSVRGSEWRGLGWDHWHSSKGWCWGCTQEKFSGGYSGSAHDPNAPPCPAFPDKMVGKFTPSQNCNFEGKFHTDGSNTHYEPLRAGTEYEIWVNHTKLWFRCLETKTIIQKVPGHDDFNNLDWTPPGGGTGDTEIPLTDPEIPMPEPGANVVPPEPDLPTPDIDPGGGEPEITPLEPDITPDIDPTPDVPEVDPVPDVSPPDITPDADPPTDPDTTPDTGDKDPGDKDPFADTEKPEDFD